MNKEHTFGEAELIGSMGEALAHAKGKLTLKTTQVPAPSAKMTAAGVARIRKTLKASTPVFAAYLNVTPDTVRNWEKNRRRPTGAALRLLEIAARRPEILARWGVDQNFGWIGYGSASVAEPQAVLAAVAPNQYERGKKHSLDKRRDRTAYPVGVADSQRALSVAEIQTKVIQPRRATLPRKPRHPA
jgi:putative transcriptional regulator